MNVFLLGFVVFSLGIRHGFDADHLAVIDGLTRFNSRANPKLARYCGALFSLGHGAVVLAISVLVGLFAWQLRLPAWLESFGDWVSIAFLTLLGILNLHAVATTRPDQAVHLVGLKGKLLGSCARAASPGLVALVGALFAISFDTLSQAALFSMTASRFGGWENALLMGGLFMLGMLFTDGVNGFWIFRLLNRTDGMTLAASRTMGFAVSGLSLFVAALGAARLSSPLFERWSEGKEMIFGLAVIGIVLSAFAFASRAASTLRS